MAVSKSSVRMDYWREYFRSADANIFEIIEGAIMLAASDCPKEFKARRDTIAQILYTCKLIKCSGCDREELALPVDNNEEYNDHHDHDHDHGDDGDEGVKYKSNLSDANVNYSKESSKVINCSRNNDDDDEYENDDDDDDDEHHHDVEANDHVSKYSYGDAEALTDEIEEESQTFNEVLRIKEIVDNSSDESSSVLCNSLRKLQLMAISVETLKATEIGKSVNVLRKHTSKDIRQIARKLIEVWKDMVDEWVDATNKATISENTPESINPSVLDEEEGLPSPPLEDLAFLDPHSMSLELNEFFDGMDDYGNLRKSNEFNKNGNNGRKPPVEKQNITKWAQQKPSNGSNMAPKPDVVKPSRPPVFDATPRRRTPNVDRKLQNLEKPTSPNGPVTPQQRKLMSSNEEIEKDKLEATKRKLQERYQQAEKAKKQRTIQVMELHDLPKQNVLTKNQHTRPGSNHNRNRMHGRF
ncbi:probable mediator of RNA polymerase II transcription subunit 26b isoform X2 [Rutidosis leptorrhynchoides]|uniref:probable mediator of RNA polymerase II transcription subunit 26b isoform X2 n=1 Tax=Rutidosis leptorrhynchoides TaxID=125765 RepID=UPI003A9A278B